MLIAAVSGIAALLLPGGRTAHSRFRLPCALAIGRRRRQHCSQQRNGRIAPTDCVSHLGRGTECSTCSFGRSQPLSSRRVARLPNRNKQQPFGGMPVLLGGDFRQIPPALRRVDIHEFPVHTLKACDWWISGTHAKRYKLARNKRAEEDPDYANMICKSAMALSTK